MAIVNVTDGEFNHQVLEETEKSVLVDFWAEWCGPCKMLAPVIESMSQAFPDRLKVCKLDTDANPVSAQKYQITGIPCCIIFKDGKEVSRIVGYRSESAFKEELSNVI